MIEQIILVSGVNEKEFLRTFTKFGKNTIGVRVLNAVELAKMALMKSGIFTAENFLTRGEQPSVIYSFLRDIGYFASASFSDAENLSSALDLLRELIISEDEKTEIETKLVAGEFKKKNAAIIEVYRKYTEVLRQENLVDSVGIIRKALDKADCFDADFICFREYPLKPLERALLNKVSEGKARELSITDYLGKESDPKSTVYTEGYGAVNEVEHIISYVYKHGIPLDKCVVACANSDDYSQLFYDLSSKYAIPMTFGCGVPITNSNPARLLKLISIWDTTGYNGTDALKRIIYSEAFDRNKLGKALGLEELHRRNIDGLCETAGALRLCFNESINDERIAKYKNVLETQIKKAEKAGNKELARLNDKMNSLERAAILSKEFAAGITAFLGKYVVLRPEPAGRIDQSAINIITRSIDAYLRYSGGANLSGVIPEILNKTVCSEISREGALHVTSLKGAVGSLRENLFVCGLSAMEFPGTPTENYLLLDEDLLLFAGDEDAPTSVKRVNDNKRTLSNLISVAKSAGVSINLSYSGYNLSELKNQNPSSVLFKIYEEEHPGNSMDDFQNAFEKTGYFENGLSNSEPVGAAYADGSILNKSELLSKMPGAGNTFERAWSPSALELFFQCPRRFYLSKVLNLPEEEPDNPFTVISAADIGTLAHRMMENLAADEMTEDSFLDLCEKAFDEYLASRPPIHPTDAEKEKKNFLDMMHSAFEQDPHNEVLSAEEEYIFEHPTGVKLHGYPDRVEKEENGDLIIADFKTGRKVKHKKNDIESCFQVIVYAWLLEQAGKKITRCEYRYLRKNITVSCAYDNTMKERLNRMLSEFREAVEKNDFPKKENKDICKYCKMGDICNWEKIIEKAAK